MLSKIINGVLWVALLAVVLTLIIRIYPPLPAASAMPAPNTIVRNAPIGTPTTGESKITLTDARAAYWRGDIEGAIGMYSDYIKDYPKDIDANGELGNIYYGLGRRSEAAQAYHDAVQIMIYRSESLLPVIFEIDPSKGNDLIERIFSARLTQTSDSASPLGPPTLSR